MSEYVFGPVPSRRLGRSLGIDLVPFKTCTYNCIYCQGMTDRQIISPVDLAHFFVQIVFIHNFKCTNHLEHP